MKKILSLIISLSMIVSCCNLSAFAMESSLIEAPASSSYDCKYLETNLMNKLGLKTISEYIDKLYTSFEESSIIDKSIILSFLFSIPIFTSDFGKFMRNIWFVKYFTNDLYEYVKEKFSLKHNNLIEPEKALSVLGNELELLKGQNQAKEKIINIVSGIIYEKEMAKLKNKNYDHGDIIYMLGPSGVGKSFTASKIAHALSTSEPFIISASEVDPQSKKSIVKQLFRFYGYSDIQDDSSRPSHNLVEYIKNNKNGVVIINEYDKMWDKSLDEILRTVVDQGVVSINGNLLNCSGITFIITSNESSLTVKGGNQDVITEIDDGTGSRTSVNHDRSFMNRVKLVEFENLTQNDYEEIIKSEYNSEYFKYWENLLKIKIDLGETISHIAKKAVMENSGALVIKNTFNKLIKKLIILKSDIINNKDKSNAPKDYLLSYDENIDEFFIKAKNIQG